MNSIFATDYFVIPPNLSGKETLRIAETACESGKKVVLNIVPPQKIQRKLLRYVSVAIFDEQQIGELTKVAIRDIASAKTAALKLYGRGAETVIIKMKPGKVLVFTDEVFSFFDSLEQDFSFVVDEAFLKAKMRAF